jgi:hypothetical protein
MHGSITMTKGKEGEKKSLNKNEPRINRGFELMLRKNIRREKVLPKSFQIHFGKMISFFSREIHFEFNFFINKKK